MKRWLRALLAVLLSSAGAAAAASAPMKLADYLAQFAVVQAGAGRIRKALALP